MHRAVALQVLAHDDVGLLADAVARGHEPRVRPLLRGEREPARGRRAREVVGLHLGDVLAQLLERLADLAREARLDGERGGALGSTGLCREEVRTGMSELAAGTVEERNERLVGVAERDIVADGIALVALQSGLSIGVQ